MTRTTAANASVRKVCAFINGFLNTSALCVCGILEYLLYIVERGIAAHLVCVKIRGKISLPPETVPVSQSVSHSAEAVHSGSSSLSLFSIYFWLITIFGAKSGKKYYKSIICVNQIRQQDQDPGSILSTQWVKKHINHSINIGNTHNNTLNTPAARKYITEDERE
uniref:Uncharacterized protein n=1 Tax=Glossina pallidipes TaxID=7398 RepID=A0A1A9ZIX7_GLOPL